MPFLFSRNHQSYHRKDEVSEITGNKNNTSINLEKTLQVLGQAKQYATNGEKRQNVKELYSQGNVMPICEDFADRAVCIVTARNEKDQQLCLPLLGWLFWK